MSQSCAGLLKAAVLQSPALSKQGLLEHLFCMWFSGFVYNQIWEDPRTDIEAMALRPGHRVLTIASGGCNVCHYLLEGVESVTAVDLNIHHVHLSRLKLEAARCLPTYDMFFRFFGHAEDNANLWAYTRYLEARLPSETAAYWASSRSFLGGPRIGIFAKNLYEHARMGQFLGLLRTLCRLTGRDPKRILEARSLAEQREAYSRELEPLLSGRIARFLSKSALAVFSLGIPPQQYRALERECPGGVLEAYRKRVEKLACNFPLEDNPFAWQAFGRRYDRIGRKALPEYLRPENFLSLKSTASRAEILHDSLDNYLVRQPAGSLDRYVLLDSQDWMTPEAITALWDEITRTARPGARVIFRTGGARSPLEDMPDMPARRRFRYEEATSRALSENDRSSIYGAFHLYVLKD